MAQKCFVTHQLRNTDLEQVLIKICGLHNVRVLIELFVF